MRPLKFNKQFFLKLKLKPRSVYSVKSYSPEKTVNQSLTVVRSNGIMGDYNE